MAIGQYTSDHNQGFYSVAIGTFAGEVNQGAHAIAIGARAGSSNQFDNSIILNATGSALTTAGSGLYLAPIREATGSKVLQYDPSTKEIIASNMTRMNYSATVPPTSNDDVNFYYSVGSMWIDVVATQAYICIDNT